MKKLSKAELLDFATKWGYVPLDRTGAQLLFEVISECYERNTLIINTNIEFPAGVNVFYDEQMTGADSGQGAAPLPLLLFPGQSNRMRESGLRQ